MWIRLTHLTVLFFFNSYIFDIVEDVSLLFKRLSIAYREGFFCHACLASFCCRTCRWRSRLGHRGKPESWRGEALKVGSVGAQQRWCFVDGWEFQATNIFWMGDAASPLGTVKHHVDFAQMRAKWWADFKRCWGEDAQNHQCLVSILFYWKVLSRLPSEKTIRVQIPLKINATLQNLQWYIRSPSLLHLDDAGLKLWQQKVRCQMHIPWAKSLLPRRRKWIWLSLQEIAKSDPQQAASKGLAEGMIRSEILTEAAKALMDSAVQSKFHQLHMASHVFMILPLVHASTSRGSHALGEEVVNLIMVEVWHGKISKERCMQPLATQVTQVALTSLPLKMYQPHRGSSQEPWKTPQWRTSKPLRGPKKPR